MFNSAAHDLKVNLIKCPNDKFKFEIRFVNGNIFHKVHRTDEFDSIAEASAAVAPIIEEIYKDSFKIYPDPDDEGCDGEDCGPGGCWNCTL